MISDSLKTNGLLDDSLQIELPDDNPLSDRTEAGFEDAILPPGSRDSSNSLVSCLGLGQTNGLLDESQG